MDKSKNVSRITWVMHLRYGHAALFIQRIAHMQRGVTKVILELRFTIMGQTADPLPAYHLFPVCGYLRKYLDMVLFYIMVW